MRLEVIRITSHGFLLPLRPNPPPPLLDRRICPRCPVVKRLEPLLPRGLVRPIIAVQEFVVALVEEIAVFQLLKARMRCRGADGVVADEEDHVDGAGENNQFAGAVLRANPGNALSSRWRTTITDRML